MEVAKCARAGNIQKSAVQSVLTIPAKKDEFLRISKAATIINDDGDTLRGGKLSCVQCPIGTTSNPKLASPPSCAGDWSHYECNSGPEAISCLKAYSGAVSPLVHNAIRRHSNQNYQHHYTELCAHEIKKHCAQEIKDDGEFDYMTCRACAAKHKFQSCKWKTHEVERVCERMESQVVSAQDRFHRGVEYIPAYLLSRGMSKHQPAFEAASAEIGACFVGRTIDIMNVMYALAHCHHYRARNRHHPCSPYLADDLVINLRSCCHGMNVVVSQEDEHLCKAQLLPVLNTVESLVKPAFDECVTDSKTHLCQARRDAYNRCQKSGKYPDDARDCDAAFDVVMSSYKGILKAARTMYSRAPPGDVSPTAGVLLDMCESKFEAEYLGEPPGCVKDKPCEFTPVMRDCQENMFITMKKLRHKECDDPNDVAYDC